MLGPKSSMMTNFESDDRGPVEMSEINPGFSPLSQVSGNMKIYTAGNEQMFAEGSLKDTVFVSPSVLRWSRHVEQDQLSSLRLVHNHLVQLDSCVHAADVRLVPSLRRPQ